MHEDCRLRWNFCSGDGGVIYHAHWRGLDVVAKMLKTESDQPSAINAAVAKADLINEISVLTLARSRSLHRSLALSLLFLFSSPSVSLYKTTRTRTRCLNSRTLSNSDTEQVWPSMLCLCLSVFSHTRDTCVIDREAEDVCVCVRAWR
jgi:hypothetical protein